MSYAQPALLPAYLLRGALASFCQQPEAERRARIHDVLQDAAMIDQFAAALPPEAAASFRNLVLALKAWL